MTSFIHQMQASVIAHAAWKGRLALAITTGASDLKVDAVRRDDICRFGRWLYAEGEYSFPSAADYEDVRMLHAEFHVEAAEVLSLAVSGQRDRAAAATAIGSPFSQVSSRLVTALMSIRLAAA